MFLSVDKVLHFLVGIAVGAGFWWLLECRANKGSLHINPICYLVMLVWGASGLFIFRKLNIPVLSHQLFYMAIPDWDIPLYQWTRFRFLIHRSWLFHSTLIPTAGLIAYISIVFGNWLPKKLWKLQLLSHFRDSAVGLSIGMSAHLIWDALQSSTRKGFRIHEWDQPTSFLWLIVNLLASFGLAFLVVKFLDIASKLDNTR